MIRGEKTALRALELSDAELHHRFMSDPEVTRHLDSGPPTSLDGQRQWLEEMSKAEGEVWLAIVALPELQFIGSCGLGPLTAPDRSARLGICLGDRAYWGSGYGTDAMLTLCGYGFAQCNLHRIELHVFAENGRAVRCYEKCGFALEARLREAHYCHGRYGDTLVMALLGDEYRSRWPQRWEAFAT